MAGKRTGMTLTDNEEIGPSVEEMFGALVIIAICLCQETIDYWGED